MQNGSWYTVGASKLRSCKRCGAQNLAWVQSKRTGRWYLAMCQPLEHKYSESRQGLDMDIWWVKPNQPHSCQQVREMQARAEREQARSTEAARGKYVEAIFNLARGFGAAEDGPEVRRALDRLFQEASRASRPDDPADPSRAFLAILADLQADLDGTTEFARVEAEQEQAAYLAEMREEMGR